MKGGPIGDHNRDLSAGVGLYVASMNGDLIRDRDMNFVAADLTPLTPQ